MDNTTCDNSTEPVSDEITLRQVDNKLASQVSLRLPLHELTNESNGLDNVGPVNKESSPNVLFKKMVEENQKRNSKVIQKLEIERRSLPNGNSLDQRQPSIKVRFLVCLLALTGLALSQMSRMVINITITSMVDPRLLDNKKLVSSDGSCPIQQDNLPSTTLPTVDDELITEIQTTTITPNTTTSIVENNIFTTTGDSDSTQHTTSSPVLVDQQSDQNSSDHSGTSSPDLQSTSEQNNEIQAEERQMPAHQPGESPAENVPSAIYDDAAPSQVSVEYRNSDDTTLADISEASNYSSEANNHHENQVDSFDRTRDDQTQTNQQPLSDVINPFVWEQQSASVDNTDSHPKSSEDNDAPKFVDNTNREITFDNENMSNNDLVVESPSDQALTNENSVRVSPSEQEQDRSNEATTIDANTGMDTQQPHQGDLDVAQANFDGMSKLNSITDNSDSAIDPSSVVTKGDENTEASAQPDQSTDTPTHTNSEQFSEQQSTIEIDGGSRNLETTQSSTDQTVSDDFNILSIAWDQNRRRRRSIEQTKDETDSGNNNDKLNLETAQTSLPEPYDESLEDKFGWGTKERNMVLGGFYSSYFVFMIIGGRLAEIYGSKYIILLSVFGSALVNLFTPWMAKTNFYLLVASRVALGAMQSGIFPGCYALFAKWLTLSETSIFAPLIKVSLRLGSMLGSFLPGLIIRKSGVGWQNVFYTTGALCLMWSIPWLFLVSSFPEDNRFVSQAELNHIQKKKRKFNVDLEQATPMGQLNASTSSQTVDSISAESSAQKSSSKSKDNSTPWLNIITSGSVIALIIAKLSFNYVVDFMCIQLPSYLKYVHHADQQQTSWIITPIFAIQVVFVTVVAYFAKEAVRRKPCGLQKTGVRKLFQGTASFGAALMLFLVTLNNCSLLYVGIIFQVLSFLTMFVAGGEVVLPYDLSDEFQATIMGIANSIANLSGITVTYMTAKILGDQGSSADRWHLIINLIAIISLIGGIVFTLLARAEYIDFRASKQSRKEKKSENENERDGSANRAINTGVSKM